MNKNGYGSKSYDKFPDKKPFKLTDFEVDDFNMLLFLSDEDKVEWLKTLQRSKNLDKKGKALDKLSGDEDEG